MNNNYISYYELLTMIKERNIPPKIMLHLVQDKSVEYISDYDYINSEFIGYEILNDKEEDENYHYQLGDCFLESTMFDRVIEIIEEEKEIEKLDITDRRKLEDCTPLTVEIMAKINELIDEIKKLKEE